MLSSSMKMTEMLKKQKQIFTTWTSEVLKWPLSGPSAVVNTTQKILKDHLPEVQRASATTVIRLVTSQETAEAAVGRGQDHMNAAEEIVTEATTADPDPQIADMVAIAVKIEMTVIVTIEDAVEGQDHQVMIGIDVEVVVIVTETTTVVIEVDHQEIEEGATKKESAVADLPNKKAKVPWIENKDSVQTALIGKEDLKKYLKVQDKTSVKKGKVLHKILIMEIPRALAVISIISLTDYLNFKTHMR
jgi:hypothetical protein